MSREINLIKMKISKRDIVFFITGVFTVLIINFILNWDKNIKSMNDGWNAGSNAAKTEVKN